MTTTIAPAQPCMGLGSPGSAATMLRSVNLSGPAGRLEALLNKGAPDATFAALVCHPHPLGGGTFHNKVVYHALKVLNDAEWGLGWPVLRFNFRGVGLSAGAHDGEAESEDVLTAMEWLENEYKLPLVVVGFSFGAAMAVKACCGPGTSGTAEKLAISGVIGVKHPSGAKQAAEKPLIWVKCDEKHTSGAKARVDSVDLIPGMNPWPTARTSFSAACKAQGDCVGFMRGLKPPPPSESSFSATCSRSIGANVGALALLGLPTQADGRHFHYAFLRDCIIPKLFLSGDCDSFAPGEQLAQVAAAAAEPKRMVLIPDADHFFTGQLEPMQHALSSWLKEQLL